MHRGGDGGDGGGGNAAGDVGAVVAFPDFGDSAFVDDGDRGGECRGGLRRDAAPCCGVVFRIFDFELGKVDVWCWISSRRG